MRSREDADVSNLREGTRETALPRGAATEWTAAGIVARLDALVAERDGGNVRRAAARCGVPRAALAELAGSLADDTRDGCPEVGELLAAVARAYRVDATWLVTGAEDFHGDRLAAAARLRIADLLLHVGQGLLSARRCAVSPPTGTVYDSPHDSSPPP